MTHRIEFSRPEKDMAAMTATELEQLQVQWYAEATMRGVLPIIVYVDDYGGYFTVEVRGKRVVSTHTCDRLFVPGAWLEPILALHQAALDKAAARKNGDEEGKRARLLETLGALSE